MGDTLGDGGTCVSGLFVPLIFILYYNAKSIADLLVIALFSYFTVTLLRNLRLSIPRRDLVSISLIEALLLNLSYNNRKQSQNNTVFANMKKWTGWDLNPRPAPVFCAALLIIYLMVRVIKVDSAPSSIMYSSYVIPHCETIGGKA
jgi:hypothetical protein